MEEHKFNGYDFTELFPVLGVQPIDYNTCEYDYEYDVFHNALNNLYLRLIDCEDVSKEILAIKLYLSAMSKTGATYWSPVWDGMVEVEDDDTFILACMALSCHMWT